MIKLIKNELIKIFSKKSLYIILLLIFIAIFYTTYKSQKEEEYSEYWIYIANKNLEISSIDTTTYQGLVEYTRLKTDIEIAKSIKDNYGEESWQMQVYFQSNNIAHDMFFDYVFLEQQKICFEGEKYEFEEIIDQEESKKKFDSINNIFKNNDWIEFAKLLISKYEENIEDIKTNKDNLYDEKEIKEIIRENEVKISSLEMRIKENIPFAFDYLNEAIQEYELSTMGLYYIKNNNDDEYTNKLAYQQFKERQAKSIYIIENKQDIQNTDTSRYRIGSVFNLENQQIYIVLLIILVTAVIVSEEYNKGTIKQLLIRPYTRMQIIVSKFVASICVMITITVLVVLMVCISNIMIYGTDTLNIPMIIYNFNEERIVSMNMFEYLCVQFALKLPMFLSICIIAFGCSTIFGSTIIASIAPIFVYFFNILGVTGINEKTILYTRYFLTTNWDLSNYLFGKLPEFEVMNVNFSIAIILIYFILILIPTFVFFIKGDIKNR